MKTISQMIYNDLCKCQQNNFDPTILKMSPQTLFYLISEILSIFEFDNEFKLLKYAGMKIIEDKNVELGQFLLL